MLHPSYTDLMNVVNSEVDEGSAPLVQSRYSIVIATAKRARQIIAGDEPLISGSKDRKPLSIAIDELYDGKVKILSVDQTDDDDEKLLELANDVFDMPLDVDEAEIFEDHADDFSDNDDDLDFEDEDED